MSNRDGPPPPAEPDEPAGGERETSLSPVILAQSVPPPAATPVWPRIWPTIVVSLVCVPAATVVAMLSLAAVLAITRSGEFLQARESVQQANMMQWVEELATRPVGLFVLVLPGQLVFVGIAAVAAWLSPQPLAQRLRMVPGRAPLWAWILLALATPAIGHTSSWLISLFHDQLSEHLEALNQLLRSQLNWSMTAVLFLVSVVPGVSEELLFRGYIQSRLIQRWSPLQAIGFSALLFASAHMDAMHALGVLPLGIWLGVVAWRTASVWPAVLCHMSNNSLGVLELYLQPDDQVNSLSEVTMGVLLVSFLALAVSIVVLVRSRPVETGRPQDLPRERSAGRAPPILDESDESGERPDERGSETAN